RTPPGEGLQPGECAPYLWTGPLAPAVPMPQVLGDRLQEVSALVPARRRPLLDVQVAGRGVAGLAHDADPLPGAHPLSLAEMGPPLQVRIHPIVPGLLAVDH